MYLEKEPKRVHNDVVLEPPEPGEQPAPGDVEVAGGDPRLIDHVRFESGARATSPAAFCVPRKSGGGGGGGGVGAPALPRFRPRSARHARGEAAVARHDLALLVGAILLAQDEGRRCGYWELGPGAWRAGDEATPVFEFGSLVLAARCEERKLVRISSADVVAMLGPCLDSSPEGAVVQKVASTWVSHTDSDMVCFKWELQGLRKAEVDPKARNPLAQMARSFFKTRSRAGGN